MISIKEFGDVQQDETNRREYLLVNDRAWLANQQTVSAQPCSPAPVGLASWWSGDGNALDSRLRNNGTLVGNVSFGAGQVGQAFDFANPGGRVEVPDSANLNISGSFHGRSVDLPRSFPNPGPRIFDKDDLNAHRWLLALTDTLVTVTLRKDAKTQRKNFAMNNLTLDPDHMCGAFNRHTSTSKMQKSWR